MRTSHITLVLAATLAGLLGLQNADEPPEQPPAQPPIQPQLPPGHVPIKTPEEAIPADPQDVASIDAIIAAYYAVISGPIGQARDWDRFRSLFITEARLVTARASGDRITPLMLTPAQFVQLNQKYFERGGYFESEAHRRADAFGCIAHVFSTYESRRKSESAKPYSRGINSIQLLNTGDRWWIVSITWDHERPAHGPIPSEYLPTRSDEDG
ncbi:MAG: hypothetical protein ACYSXF_01575 [Planctomycetota bacterium]|jgi:hypothetical protein